MINYSNRTIVALVAVALLVTVVGTVVSVSTLSELGGTYTYLTGAATSTSTGLTNITITSTTSITLTNTQVNFGSGRVNATCNFCEMLSGYVMGSASSKIWSYYANGTNTSAPTFPQTAFDTNCCVSFSTSTQGILIENTGNVNVSVGYTCSGNCTHTLFIGGNRAPGMGGLTFAVNKNSAGIVENGVADTGTPCEGGGSYYRDSGINITNATSYTDSTFSRGNYSFYPLSSQGHWLCGNYTHSPLMPDNLKDALVVDFNVTVPADAVGTGVQSSFTLTFNATSQ